MPQRLEADLSQIPMFGFWFMEIRSTALLDQAIGWGSRLQSSEVRWGKMRQWTSPSTGQTRDVRMPPTCTHLIELDRRSLPLLVVPQTASTTSNRPTAPSQPSSSGRMRKKTASGVLASLRGSPYGTEYDSPLRLLRPCCQPFCASCMAVLHSLTLGYS